MDLMPTGITLALFSNAAFALGPGKAVTTFGKASRNDIIIPPLEINDIIDNSH
jgi:hypothetical protein